MLSFLDKIGGFFDKAMLVAAVLPLLVGAMILSALAGLVIGVGNLTAWWGGLTTAANATLTVVLTLALFVAAFVLRSLRSWLIDVWSGGHWWWEVTGLGPILEAHYGRQRDRLVRFVNERACWLHAEDGFRKAIPLMLVPGQHPKVTDAERDKLVAEARALWEQRRDFRSPDLITRYENLLTDVRLAHLKYNESSLEPVYSELVKLSRDLDDTEAEAKGAAIIKRDLRFGTAQRVRPNVLGNVLAALDAYPTRRYGMEGSVFWTHLETVLKDPVLGDVREQRILLDMALALATIMSSLAAGVAVAGPWLVHDPILIAAGTAFFAVSSFVFYQVAVNGAEALSRSLRAGCDLYRQDLLKALQMPAPANLAAERIFWERLSTLAVYGRGSDQDAAKLVFRPQSQSQ